jgi:hypothetical protein
MDEMENSSGLPDQEAEIWLDQEDTKSSNDEMESSNGHLEAETSDVSQ